MADAPVLSIITGTRGRQASVARLVKSVVANTADVDWELLIADANDHPGTVYFPHTRVKVVPERPRMGFSRGHNVLVREHATGEYVVWLNDDAEVLPRWALAMLSALRDRPEIGLGVFPYHCVGAHAPYTFHANEWPMGLLYANFGCLRRDLFLRVGGFDERLRLYGADNSLSLRVMADGLGVAVVPGARLLHHYVEDRPRQENAATNDGLATSLLFSEYADRFDRFKREQSRFRRPGDLEIGPECRTAADARALHASLIGGAREAVPA